MGESENATIIAASLQDDELKKAVQTLVETVESQTNKMAESFTNAVNTMAASMNGLIESQKSYTQHVERESKARISTYDKEAEAQRRIIRSSENPSTLYVINPNGDGAAQYQAMIDREKELLKQKEEEEAVTKRIAQQEQAITSIKESQKSVVKDNAVTSHDMLYESRKILSSQTQRKKSLDEENLSMRELESRLKRLKQKYDSLDGSTQRGVRGEGANLSDARIRTAHAAPKGLRKAACKHGERIEYATEHA